MNIINKNNDFVTLKNLYEFCMQQQQQGKQDTVIEIGKFCKLTSVKLENKTKECFKTYLDKLENTTINISENTVDAKDGTIYCIHFEPQGKSTIFDLNMFLNRTGIAHRFPDAFVSVDHCHFVLNLSNVVSVKIQWSSLKNILKKSNYNPSRVVKKFILENQSKPYIEDHISEIADYLSEHVGIYKVKDKIDFTWFTKKMLFRRFRSCDLFRSSNDNWKDLFVENTPFVFTMLDGITMEDLDSLPSTTTIVELLKLLRMSRKRADFASVDIYSEDSHVLLLESNKILQQHCKKVDTLLSISKETNDLKNGMQFKPSCGLEIEAPISCLSSSKLDDSGSKDNLTDSISVSNDTGSTEQIGKIREQLNQTTEIRDPIRGVILDILDEPENNMKIRDLEENRVQTELENELNLDRFFWCNNCPKGTTFYNCQVWYQDSNTIYFRVKQDVLREMMESISSLLCIKEMDVVRFLILNPEIKDAKFVVDFLFFVFTFLETQKLCCRDFGSFHEIINKRRGCKKNP